MSRQQTMSQKMDMDCWSGILAFLKRSPLTLLAIASASKELQRLVRGSLPSFRPPSLAIYSHRSLLAPAFKAIGYRLGNQYIVSSIRGRPSYTTSFTKDEFPIFFESLSDRHTVFLVCVMKYSGY